jgi:hypothetical protein
MRLDLIRIPVGCHHGAVQTGSEKGVDVIELLIVLSVVVFVLASVRFGTDSRHANATGRRL